MALLVKSTKCSRKKKKRYKFSMNNSRKLKRKERFSTNNIRLTLCLKKAKTLQEK